MTTAREMVTRGQMVAGDAVVASRQTAGRGQLGRVWHAESGAALLMTAYNRTSLDPARFGLISIAAAGAVSDVLAGLGLHPQIKWPNDVLIDHAKVAGILIQTQIGPSSNDVYAGFGINVFSRPALLAGGVTCLADHLESVPEVARVARQVLDRWADALQSLERGDSTTLRHWRDRAAWVGETISVRTDRELTGIHRGIDLSGRLIVETAEGSVALVSGEVSRGPRRVG